MPNRVVISLTFEENRMIQNLASEYGEKPATLCKMILMQRLMGKVV